jgi:uncharacterized DUF497 family protein
MRIRGVVWLREIVDKLAVKHHVEPHEVEEVLANTNQFRFLEKGERRGEDVYIALGQPDAGRYLTVLFIYKKTREALILSARDMAAKEENSMVKNKAKRLPRLKSVDELVEFFDRHDMGDYWDRLPKAEFEVKIKTRKHLVAIDENIIPRINQIAKSKRVTSAKLINTWLREKVANSKRA